MSIFVVDASVAAKWFLEEDYATEAFRLLAPENTLHAPDFMLLEIDHVLCKKVRRDELTEEEGEEIRDALEVFPIHLHPFNPLRDRAYAMACSLRRGIYDCLYLTMATLLDGKMVTADRKFFNALSGGPLAKYVLWIEDVSSGLESPATPR